MESRLKLQDELKQFLPNVYFQPPSDIRLVFPCITYSKTSKDTKKANNDTYKSAQEYQITVIELDPDSDLADRIVAYFQYATFGSYFVVDRLHQTTIKLYF